MIAIKEIDFEHECQKLKEKLAQMEQIKERKMKLQQQKAALKEKRIEDEQLKKELQEARDELQQISADVSELAKIHQLQQDKRSVEENETQRILSSSREDVSKEKKLEDLKVRLALARESVALYEDEIRIEEQTRAIQEKNDKIKELSSDLLAKEKTISFMDAQICNIEEDCEKLEGQWRKDVHFESTIPIEKHDEMLSTQDAKISALEAKVKQVDEKMRVILPLMNVGIEIRNRKLEWEKKSQKNEKLIDLGNQASHQGRALADAMLYHPLCPDRRTDPETYVAMYGLAPHLVYNRVSAAKFLEMLDWRGGMKDFYAHAYTEYERSPRFEELSKGVLLRSKDWDAARFKAYFDESDEGKKCYEEMKTLFKAALARHRIHLKNKER